ncbi:MAG: hypothetical protein JO171_12490 [Paludibacterium sp.]|uniref:hypothetical protein n=1 Tax=Paludibacterium sp. TaxID=1917523 RepID=UPI0025DC3666|nr:hypothetical protein [Paludibacterium sp.]MBV8047971.1 hypothetical protein [Paludibacterium sp.]MBV8649139.1 hypothetical protein [Paludibacterium sp.]
MKWIGKIAAALIVGLMAANAMAAHVVVGVGVGFGPYWRPPVYVVPAPAYYYPPPAVVVQPAPAPVYVQQAPANEVSTAPAPSNTWYYCGKPKGYYPYVPKCKMPWQPVPGTPPQEDGAP